MALPKKIIPFLGIVICLIPILFYPITNDHSIFMRGGAIILKGGKIYQDFIDIKPPAIYYIFALSQLLFGTSEISIRIFDLLWQIATAVLLWHVMLNVTQDKVWSYLSALIYAISYTSINYSQSLQCESFASILIIGIIYFCLRKTNTIYDILIGLFCGLLIALKYTLGVVFAAVCISILINNRSTIKIVVIRYCTITVGLIAGLGIGLFPLFDPEVFYSFKKVLAYTAKYATPDFSGKPYFVNASESTGIFFCDYYTLLFTILMLIGILLYIKRRMIIGKFINSDVISLSIIIGAMLYFSIAVERKFLPYHFLRLYVPLAILSGYGLLNIINKWRNLQIGQLVTMGPVLLASVIMSPLARYINLLPMIFFYFFNVPKYDSLYERNYFISVNRIQHKEIAQYIRPQLKDDQKVLVMSIGGTNIYNFLGQFTSSKFGQSQFYFADGVPQEWLDAMYTEVSNATWLVIQTNDVYLGLNAHNRTSFESMNADKKLSGYIYSNFQQAHKTKDFIVFKRIS